MKRLGYSPGRAANARPSFVAITFVFGRIYSRLPDVKEGV
jgi:hypothetical protein